MNDEMIMQKLQRKEQEVLSHIIDTYSKLLWVIVGGILGKVGTTQDIEECISDIYLQVWNNPAAFNPEKGNLKTFIAVIAKNKALDLYRKLSKIMIAELDEAINGADDDLLGYIVNKESCDELYAAIKTLTEPNKEIVVRRYFFDEKPSKIAESISLTVKDVENRLYQSKLKLRKKLSDSRGVAV